MDFILQIIGASLVLLAIACVIVYNRLVQLRERCHDSWSQIDIQMKRRYDLIPNLVEVVKGYAKFERSVFENIAKARSMFEGAKTVGEKFNANEQMQKSVKSLIAVAENYPVLKANENFLHLQDEISDAEERIAYSRSFYNDTALNYNNSIAIFPWNVIAGLAGMPAREYFGAAEGERKPVEVKLEEKK
ncbi:MAG: LemA family protein [Candidatus Micrarchaeota archaeon]